MPHHSVKTIIYWIVAAVVFLGVVGYEWLPTGYRGSWLFVCALVVCGAFVRFMVAILIGLGAFFAVSIYFLFDLTDFSHIERQILLLFTVTFAPLFLSAVRYNLFSTHQNHQQIHQFHFSYSNEVLPLSTWQNMTEELLKMLPILAIAHYENTRIQIKNRQLITEMLGETVWKEKQNMLLSVLREKSDGIIYHFANEDLTDIRSVIFRPNASSDNMPLFAQKMLDINGLETEYKYILHDVPDSINLVEINHVPAP